MNNETICAARITFSINYHDPVNFIANHGEVLHFVLVLFLSPAEKSESRHAADIISGHKDGKPKSERSVDMVPQPAAQRGHQSIQKEGPEQHDTTNLHENSGVGQIHNI